MLSTRETPNIISFWDFGFYSATFWVGVLKFETLRAWNLKFESKFGAEFSPSRTVDRFRVSANYYHFQPEL